MWVLAKADRPIMLPPPPLRYPQKAYHYLCCKYSKVSPNVLVNVGEAFTHLNVKYIRPTRPVARIGLIGGGGGGVQVRPRAPRPSYRGRARVFLPYPKIVAWGRGRGGGGVRNPWGRFLGGAWDEIPVSSSWVVSLRSSQAHFWVS